jgi:hypothetical protein
VDVPCVNASIVGRRSHLSDGEEDEAGVADEDILSDSDKEADNVAAVEGAEAHLANGAAAGHARPLSPRPGLARWHQPLLLCPRPKTCVMRGNENTGLLNAVPVRARRQFGLHNLNQMKHCMRHRMRYRIRCLSRAGNTRCEHTTSYVTIV